jgi:hypothetical protein
MHRITSLAVCTILTACASGTAPRKQESIPAELIPAGYTAAECKVTDPGGPITETGTNGQPVTVGHRPPTVNCTHHTETITTTSRPVCHTKAGVELPLSDCCMNPDGSQNTGCTPKLQPPAE